MKIRGKPDFTILFLTLLLVGFGIVIVYSASSVFSFHKYGIDTYFVKKQLTWASIGLVFMLFTMNIPYTFYKKHFVSIALGGLFLLLIVLIPGIGTVQNGARRWIDLGFASLQPTEFANLAVILYLSALIAKKGNAIQDFRKGLFPVMVVMGVFCGVIILQPDFGSSVILMLTGLSIIVAGGANLKYLSIIGMPVGIIGFLFVFFSPYRWERMQNIGNPWADGMDGLGNGYQLVHSYFALAHGGIAGAGFGKSIEKYLYLPEAQTDFIFSIMAEELGFIGVCLFLFVYVCFLWRILLITLRVQEPFAILVGIGVVSMIAIKACFNIGGVTGLLPITGVPLPFISYGGSSLLLHMLSIGIILSISRENDKRTVQRIIDGR
ncbi:putative lipid II flippase FtsW [Aneurinibacillus aneurinilyticus]|jgi:cell division protein FtsW|uniref:Probable peptidoglycan glycosyltransferase FtsW n=2 Tax=Aneurinibacillus aneurinilyticus TaxID=1391 RepID=A0A848CWS2_ANEAE|nr:putative lipid II flippase FtsW [Aneurinibacillus aneurinilyticus]ERI03939.1 cell division protein FtsW [Aneurinibacillus aneurinilyticus ATCC 12856]MCI1693109.1 putative lipid II flippase FtsW [Aneurinibacillus aneurinilyticus]MED0671054.1 putative lipid II flippase FtsW [Aneurinibacillus aneurinilyticus]MED0705481.1 putative lipid II flippase FtsW [Aneurinibacillus aneurinilyticus]MED0721907.1 putative lipid II flippase FtsW [Aneurinibacillus aneurinilyticus]